MFFICWWWWLWMKHPELSTHVLLSTLLFLGWVLQPAGYSQFVQRQQVNDRSDAIQVL